MRSIGPAMARQPQAHGRQFCIAELSIVIRIESSQQLLPVRATAAKISGIWRLKFLLGIRTRLLFRPYCGRELVRSIS